jgi:hypothetical protein
MPEPKFKPHLIEWMDNLRKSAFEPQEKEARRLILERRARAFGLAIIEPDYLEEHATEAGIRPKTLRAALDTDEGARIAVIAACKLRFSGEADRVRASRVMDPLLDVIKNVLVAGTLPETMAGKLLDTFSKGKGNSAAVIPQTMIPPPVFNGTAAELVAEISGAGDEARTPCLPSSRL